MGLQHAAVAQGDVGSYHAIGTDVHVLPDGGTGVHNCA
jgi:hypothetical protein